MLVRLFALMSHHSMNPYFEFQSELMDALPALNSFANSLCKDIYRSEDLVQEAALRAWETRDRVSFVNACSFKAWLFTILRNCYYSDLRHKRIEVEDPNDQFALSIGIPPQHEVNLELRDLNAALRRLPDEQYTAITMVCARGLSYKQAASTCDCAVGTIKSRIGRARSTLLKTFSLTLNVDGVSNKEACINVERA